MQCATRATKVSTVAAATQTRDPFFCSYITEADTGIATEKKGL